MSVLYQTPLSLWYTFVFYDWYTRGWQGGKDGEEGRKNGRVKMCDAEKDWHECSLFVSDEITGC